MNIENVSRCPHLLYVSGPWRCLSVSTASSSLLVLHSCHSSQPQPSTQLLLHEEKQRYPPLTLLLFLPYVYTLLHSLARSLTTSTLLWLGLKIAPPVHSRPRSCAQSFAKWIRLMREEQSVDRGRVGSQGRGEEASQ